VEVDGTEALSAAECWELLTTVSVGRLVLSLKALPVIMPVQYYVDGDELAICLGYYQIPEPSIHDAIVAFGADAIDPASRSGWAVQVQGASQLPHRLGVATDCGQPTAGQIVHLRPATIEGHRIRLCPFIAALEDQSR
jgi:hypothetical protein